MSTTRTPIALEHLDAHLFEGLSSDHRTERISHSPFSMIDGALGDAYTASALYHATEDQKWWDLLMNRVSTLVEVLRTRRFDQGGLLGGLSGMAYLLTVSRRNEEEFSNALSRLNSRISTLAERKLWDLHRSIGKRREDYDYAVGLAGIAHYLFVADEQYRGLAKQICNEFAELSLQPLPHSFWTGAADLDPAMVKHTPELGNGMRDLGFAHGIAGVVAVLKVGHKVFEDPSYLTAATRLMDVLVADIAKHNHSGLSYFQTPSPASNPPRPSTKSRQAWCYGTPSAEISAAGCQLLEQQLNSSLVHGKDYFDPQLGSFNDSGLCHGVAGRQYLADQLGFAASASWLEHVENQITHFLSGPSTGVDLSFWHGIGGTTAVWAGRESSHGYAPALTILGVKK